MEEHTNGREPNVFVDGLPNFTQDFDIKAFYHDMTWFKIILLEKHEKIAKRTLILDKCKQGKICMVLLMKPYGPTHAIFFQGFLWARTQANMSHVMLQIIYSFYAGIK